MGLKKRKHSDGWTEYELPVAGHPKRLFVDSFTSSCGQINGNGVSFYFDGEGGWVVSLDDLRELVKIADESK